MNVFPLEIHSSYLIFQESVDAEGPVVEKIMSSRSVKKQVSTIWSYQNLWCMYYS